MKLKPLKEYKWLGLVLAILIILWNVQLYAELRVRQQEMEERLWEFELSAEIPFQAEVKPPKLATRFGFYLKPTGGLLSSPIQIVVLINEEPHVYLLSLYHPRKFVQEEIQFDRVIKVERLEIRVFEGIWEGWCEITD